MSKRAIYLLTGLAMAAAAYTLLVHFAGWGTACGVFFALYANNISQAVEKLK